MDTFAESPAGGAAYAISVGAGVLGTDVELDGAWVTKAVGVSVRSGSGGCRVASTCAPPITGGIPAGGGPSGRDVGSACVPAADATASFARVTLSFLT
jgi:hypothetical protein